MIKKLIAVGPTTQNNKLVNGQSMMFQMFVDHLAERNIETKIVDFGKSIKKNFGDERVSGKFNFTKLFDNVILIVRFVFVLLSNPGVPIYINTSQSKVGFIRDFFIINLANVFNRKIVAHQFGANYKTFYHNLSPTLKRTLKATLLKVTYFIVEGDYTKKQLDFLDNYKSLVRSIPNGLPERIDFNKITPKKINEPIKLFYLSNLIEGKGFWDVLEAGNILKNKYRRTIEIVFAGKFLKDTADEICKTTQEAKDLFSKKITEYGLSDNVTYVEGLYGEEKSDHFLASHFFILPSYYINEGQPVSILEAIAYGCVPIVTDYRLIPSMVNEENGFFVDPKNPKQIAERIVKCIENPELYEEKSRNAISFFHENFTAEKYVAQILDLF